MELWYEETNGLAAFNLTAPPSCSPPAVFPFQIIKHQTNRGEVWRGEANPPLRKARNYNVFRAGAAGACVVEIDAPSRGRPVVVPWAPPVAHLPPPPLQRECTDFLRFPGMPAGTAMGTPPHGIK